jgi:DNA-binding NarL/FixJ family response regulator
MQHATTGLLQVGAVDDHPVLLDGLVTTFQRYAGRAELVGRASTVRELICTGTHYDVVLLDLRLDDESRPAHNVAYLLAAGAQVLVYTQGNDHAAAREAISAGAEGIVCKADPAVELLEAIDVVAGGETYLSARLASVLESDPMLPAALSPKEREVLRLYASNVPAKSVARRLGITEGTVKTHIKRIKAKYVALGRSAGTKLDLYHRAVEDGLLSEQAPVR